MDTRSASLLDALAAHLEAIEMRDIDAFAATLASDDVRFVDGEGRIIEGRENVVAAHRAWFADDDWTFEPQILWTREEQDAGWVLTRVHYTQRGASSNFLLLFLLSGRNGDWKIVYDQNTPIR